MTKFEKEFIRMIVDARLRLEKWEAEQNDVMKDVAWKEWNRLYTLLRETGDRRMFDKYSVALYAKREELEVA